MNRAKGGRREAGGGEAALVRLPPAAYRLPVQWVFL